jgi:hypothetical protein
MVELPTEDNQQVLTPGPPLGTQFVRRRVLFVALNVCLPAVALFELVDEIDDFDEAAGAKLVYLPLCSPDFNPTENASPTSRRRTCEKWLSAPSTSGGAQSARPGPAVMALYCARSSDSAPAIDQACLQSRREGISSESM